MTATVHDIIKLMERLAPCALAEEWDNIGLQVGQLDWPVNRITVALDPLPEVVSAACAARSDLLITHHPLTLRPLKQIDFNTPIGKIIQQAAQNQLAIFAAHTNLDSASGGLNDLLVSKLGLRNSARLMPVTSSEECKLVIYAPVEHENAVLQALFDAGAGKIGAYTHCSFRNRGTGTFKPDPTAQPYSGEPGSLSQVEELRIEAVVTKPDVPHVVNHVRRRHPYETMAYDVYPLQSIEPTEGLGCIGEFEEPIELAQLADKVKRLMGLQNVRLAGRPDLTVMRAAVCSGSGASLLPLFLKSDTQVFISGDWRYHDARQVEAYDRGLVDIGHFASEHIMVEDLVRRLQAELDKADLAVAVEPSEKERDPFYGL
jgi:dinuclear metal center YbgI/SA1388 family protein